MMLRLQRTIINDVDPKTPTDKEKWVVDKEIIIMLCGII